MQTFLNFGRGINRSNFELFFLEQVCFGETKEKSIFRKCLPILDTLRKSPLKTGNLAGIHLWLHSESQMFKHRRNKIRYLQTAALYYEQNIFV